MVGGLSMVGDMSLGGKLSIGGNITFGLAATNNLNFSGNNGIAFGGSAALLDEPFSALDTLTKGEMHRWYLDVMDSIRLSTIFITHDIDEAILLSDRICLLIDGTIGDEIVIREPKPRRRDFNLSEEFLQYKRTIISKIH